MRAIFRGFASFRRSTSLTFCAVVMLLHSGFLTEGLCQSGTYEIQVKDRLEISFWESAELNSTVKVDKDGGIELPIIGRITAAGLTLNVLREKIISQMRLYNKLVTQLSIVVKEYGGNIVFVTGQVRNPGKFSFEEIPNLWDILLEAGGPLEDATLNQVAIVRNKEQGKIYTVDLLEALRDAKLDELPKIYPGDTIQISGTTSSPLVKRDEIYIFGAVASPGAHRFESESDILEVIGQAGGPTRNANLKKVKHVSVSKGTTSIAIIDLDKYMEKTIPAPMPVGAGDVIVIPDKSALLSGLAGRILTVAVTAVTTALIFKALR